MIKAIFCDWNRTIFEDEYEYVFFNSYAKQEALRYLTQLNFLKVFSIIKAKYRCEEIFFTHKAQSKHKSRDITRIVQILNEMVIRGTPASLLEQYTNYYAEDGASRLDKRILNPLRSLRSSKGIILGIISSGYVCGIHKILKKAGYKFDFVKANDFETESEHTVKFRLDILDNKETILSTFLAEHGIKSSEVIYIGDDKQDEGCLRMVEYPIVSFMANEEDKKRFQREFHAFAPKNGDDFANYLYDLVNQGDPCYGSACKRRVGDTNGEVA